MLVLYFAQTLIMFCLAGFIYGLGFGAVQPALMAMAVRKGKDKELNRSLTWS